METTESTPAAGSRLPKNSTNGAEKPAEKTNVIDWVRKNLLNRGEEQSLQNELEDIIDEHEEEGQATPEDNTILRNALKFGDLRVTDVMTPRLDICAVSADTSLEELKKYIDEHEHTRIPVFDKNLDDIVGFLHIKDLITYWITPKQFKLHEILREVIYVPPSMKISNLLVKMQSERTHMGIVVDEYGGTAGLVTIEDLVEQIVGEIEDEHDEENQEEFIKLNDGSYEVLGRVNVKKIEESLNVKICPEGEDCGYDTIAGFIFNAMGKIPRIGESLNHESGLAFKVLDADKRRIKRIKISQNASEKPITSVS